MRGEQTGITPIRGPRSRTSGLSGGIQRSQPGSGNSGPYARMWKSFPAKPRDYVPILTDTDPEPWTDFVMNYDGREGTSGLFMMIPGINPVDGPFDRVTDEPGDENSASFSSLVATPDGGVPLTITFLPGTVEWRCGLLGTQIPLPPKLENAPERVYSNNSLIIASFNT